MFKKLKDMLYPPRGVFHCSHCNQETPGQWCIRCTDKPSKGTYWDEYGHPCKPTARVSPYAQGGFVDRVTAFGDAGKETIIPLSNLRPPNGGSSISKPELPEHLKEQQLFNNRMELLNTLLRARVTREAGQLGNGFETQIEDVLGALLLQVDAEGPVSPVQQPGDRLEG